MDNDIKINRDFKEDILREQVRLTFTQLPTMQLTSFIVALVLCYVARNIVFFGNIVAWILMVMGIVSGRISLYYRFLRIREQSFDGTYWKNAYLFLALLSGLTWGVSAIIIFPAGDHGLISLFVLVIASLSASTTISHSSLKYGPTVWVGPAMLLYAVRCFWEGGELEYTVGTLILIYLFTILNYSLKHHSAIISAISLKFENLALLDEVRKANDILRRSSLIDGLTGLANRQGFDECLDREWRRSVREQRPISLIMLDIDHFKLYNDNYGHQGGDDCLKKVAAVIAGSVKRPTDLAARYGGEEFIVVLPGTDIRGATELAEKLRIEVEVLGVPHAFSATASVVTISLGVASLVPGQNMVSSHLIKLVDTMLYVAKNDGRNRVKAA